MKEFDPASRRWQVGCCHVLTINYVVATIEAILAVVSALLSGNSIRAVAHNTHKLVYLSLALLLSPLWLLTELALILDIRRRQAKRLIVYIVVQGIIFLFMISLMVFLLLTMIKSTVFTDLPTAQLNTFVIFVLLLFAAAIIGLTTFCIYILFLLRKYIQIEAYSNEVEKNTAAAMEALLKLDLVKQRLVCTENSLKEISNWTTLVKDVDELFLSGEPDVIAKRIVDLQQSLQELENKTTAITTLDPPFEQVIDDLLDCSEDKLTDLIAMKQASDQFTENMNSYMNSSGLNSSVKCVLEFMTNTYRIYPKLFGLYSHLEEEYLMTRFDSQNKVLLIKGVIRYRYMWLQLGKLQEALLLRAQFLFDTVTEFKTKTPEKYVSVLCLVSLNSHYRSERVNDAMFKFVHVCGLKIEYIANVIEDLGLRVPDSLCHFIKLLRTDEGDWNKTTANLSADVVMSVKRMRGIK
ncbi:unnamed protein product [Soboliphyme baturini]|uniref:Conserved oligomeric Golgi complex subunit 7 n=1 Tax=Soboliphyme baturini TaxID=241478 RepID=A0A183IJ99_9BILA|nr:unnamed protein product [Soboliphyme baturini]